MKNTIQFESCLKEKLNSYMELRESQGCQVLKIRHIFIVCIMGLKPSPLGETFRSTP